ncbi:fibronectin type III domain-containing protein [Methanococcoides sp. SA1]|nr:fibronectin type III domain-containing protein [Methanococcoides sp. SA1]
MSNPAEVNTAPHVSIIAPEPSANISGMFFVNASVTDNNGDAFVSNVSLNNITGKVAVYDNLLQDSLSVGFDSSLFSDGVYNITWEACENESISLFCTSDVIEIAIDNTDPLIDFNDDTTVAGNYGRDWVLGNISFSDSWINSSAIYLYDESVLVTSSASDVSPHSFNFTGLADGSYQMNASVWDLAGNVNNTGARAILLDTTDPEIIFDSSTLEEGNHSQDWIFGNVTASDNLGIANITFYLYNSTGLLNSTSYSGNNLSVNFTSLPTGMYYLNASVEDFAENIVMTGTNIYGIDAIDMEITNVGVTSLSDDSATIAWDTNENANSTVYYGMDANLVLSVSKTPFIIDHSIILDNLEQNTPYYYKVESYDIFGFNNSSDIGTFTTDSKKSNSGSSNYYYPKKPLGNSHGYGEATIRGPDTDVKYDVDEEATVDVNYTIEVAESRVTSSMWLIPLIAGILGIFFIILWKGRKD